MSDLVAVNTSEACLEGRCDFCDGEVDRLSVPTPCWCPCHDGGDER